MIYPDTGHGAMGKTGEYDMELKKRYEAASELPDS